MSPRFRFIPLVLVLGLEASAAVDALPAEKPKGFDPSGCKCVVGATLNRSLASMPVGERPEIQPMYAEPQEFTGLAPTRVTFKHRNDPAAPTYNSSPQNITTTSNFGSYLNYIEIVHTAELDPAASGVQVWAELQFQVQVAPTSIPANQYVGLAYAVWVQEDTNGDGVYGNAGDAQGYLEQTYAGPWLHTTNSTSNYAMANATQSFRMNAKSVKLRLELYGIHTGTQSGTVNVNFGWAKVTSGIKLP